MLKGLGQVRIALYSVAVIQLGLVSFTANAAPTDLKFEFDKRTGQVIAAINKGVNKGIPNPSLKRSLPQTSNIPARSVSSTDSKIPSDIESIAYAFGVNAPNRDIKLTAIKSYGDGSSRERYQHTLGGVNVFGSELIVHRTISGEVKSITGRVLSDDLTGRVSRITDKKALKFARRYAAGGGEFRPRYRRLFGRVATKCRDKSKAQSSCHGKGKKGALNELIAAQGMTLYVYNESFLNFQESEGSKLVYVVSLASKPARYSETFYIDAEKSRLYKRESDKRELYREIWDCSFYNSTGDSQGCWLNRFSSLYNYTIGRQEGAPPRGPNPLGPPFTGTTDVDSLYDLVPTIEQYYQSKFGRDAGNDRGGLGDGSTYYPWGTTTIFANINAGPFGYLCDPGTAYFSNTSMSFCLGSANYNTFGHEYAHAVTRYLNYNSDGTFNSLFYNGLSGALNESFSDIFGESFENYMTGGVDWLAIDGAEIAPLRSLSDPESVIDNYAIIGVPHPDRYSSSNFYCGSLNAGGVHHNSTVPSKAAYLTSVGGTFNGCTIRGIGFDKVEQIWYRAVAEYFSTTETFNQAYNSLRLACDDLYAPSDCEELTKALQAVEMDQPGACSGIPALPPACSQTNACILSGSFANI